MIHGAALGARDFLGLATRLAHPGCYAWQVDGDHFTEVIVFQAIR